MANYKIVDIQGVGAVYAEKLIAAGVKDTDTLLEKCAKPAGRKALAEETGISPKLILTWTNHVDLYRIQGVKLEEVNAQKNLTNRVPSEKEVEKMIEQAKELPAVMEY